MSITSFSGFEPRFFDPRNDVAFKKVFVDHADLTKSFLNSTESVQLTDHFFSFVRYSALKPVIEVMISMFIPC